MNHEFKPFFSLPELNTKHNEELLQENLIKNFNYLIENNNVQEFMGKVEDYILERIYNYVFPIIPIPDDISFCEITKSYDWINAENLGVKCNLPPEAIKDSISYILQIEERAHSVYEKLKCFVSFPLILDIL